MAIKFLNDQLFPTDIFLVDVSAGRVGINTLLPRTALEVVGTLRVWSGANTHTYVETSSGSNLGSIQGKKNSDNAVKALALNPLGGNVGINLGAGVLPTSPLHVAGNARVTGAYYDSGNSPGTSGQVLSSTATGTDWVTPTTGDITGVTAGTGMTGGGTSGTVTLNVIGGIGITANANDVAINFTEVTLGAGLDANASDSLSLDLSEFIDMTAAMLGTDEFIVLDGGAQRRKAANEIGLSIFLNDPGFTSNTGTITGAARQNRISFGSATQDDITNDEDFTIVQTTNEERIKIANGGVQVANMNTTAVAGLAGSLRYRYVPGSPKNYSYVDMCMQTGVNTFGWVNIVSNVW